MNVDDLGGNASNFGANAQVTHYMAPAGFVVKIPIGIKERVARV
jgi:hypothetical protein